MVTASLPLLSSSPPVISFLLPSTSRSFTLPSTHTQLRPRLRTSLRLTRAANVDPGRRSEDGDRLRRRVLDSLSDLCDALPPQIKTFPWTAASSRFLDIVLGLVLLVGRCLCAPVLAISSLSDMSYCAREKKLGLVPLPFLVGAAVAWAAGRAVSDLAPDFQEGVPWQLVALGASFFLLLKLPGPYYPYWIRLVVPHFANGGLLMMLWFGFRRWAMGLGDVLRSGA